jgi:unsaturated rhamnogalacturonyl hydrolase
MGWFLMAEADCIALLPPGHPGRSQLEASFRRLCAAVISVADPATGLWWQVLDQGGREGNYLETSASAMFVYALMKASSLAVLDGGQEKAALAAASRAWASLLSTQASTGEDGLFSLGGICQVAGLGGMPYRDGSWEYYLSEPVVRDDFKGLGPFILAALEMEDASPRLS